MHESNAAAAGAAVNPAEVLFDLNAGAEVADKILTLAVVGASGRIRERLWAQVVERVRPVIRKAAVDDEAESYMGELLVQYLPGAVERAGGIVALGAWAKANVAKGIADRHANLVAGRAPQAKVGSTAVRLVRALELCGGDREAARRQLAAGGFTGDTTDEAFAEAVAIQAVAAPTSLSPLDGEDDGWTHHLEARVVAPSRCAAFDRAGIDTIQECLGLTAPELAVFVAEFAADGSTAVTGARAIAEATGLDYDLTRNAQTTLRRKLRKHGIDGVREAMAAARKVEGVQARRELAAQRRADLNELLGRSSSRSTPAELKAAFAWHLTPDSTTAIA